MVIIMATMVTVMDTDIVTAAAMITDMDTVTATVTVMVVMATVMVAMATVRHHHARHHHNCTARPRLLRRSTRYTCLVLYVHLLPASVAVSTFDQIS
ncbi:hypothetical protein EUGRSUZ_C00335 [Eucalyptus grandis]|uniref:Uncharacterized protein n=2 Tax=Eucalyptus grandis TaxID=71139 RepID=A0ACC3L9J5_EUCGR|nr:hypothetical protein EUGRSUZ_C00335 [Eucalyptus grandis]